MFIHPQASYRLLCREHLVQLVILPYSSSASSILPKGLNGLTTYILVCWLMGPDNWSGVSGSFHWNLGLIFRLRSNLHRITLKPLHTFWPTSLLRAGSATKCLSKKYWGKLLGWASTLYVRESISIIGLKGEWIVPLKRGINLQTRLGPLLKFQRRIILASFSCIWWEDRKFLSVRKVMALCPECALNVSTPVHSSHIHAGSVCVCGWFNVIPRREHCLREAGAGGWNPLTPTINWLVYNPFYDY